MNPILQDIRSYLALGLFIFMVSMSLPGVALSTEAKLDLNTATSQQLEQLPGIGKEIAQRIVTYRKEVGPFKSVAELENVKGIGPRKLAKVKDLLTIKIHTQSSRSK